MGYAADKPVEETSLSPRQSTYFWCRQWVADAGLARRLTAETLADLGLGDRADKPVGTLSYGLRQPPGRRPRRSPIVPPSPSSTSPAPGWTRTAPRGW